MNQLNDDALTSAAIVWTRTTVQRWVSTSNWTPAALRSTPWASSSTCAPRRATGRRRATASAGDSAVPAAPTTAARGWHRPSAYPCSYCSILRSVPPCSCSSATLPTVSSLSLNLNRLNHNTVLKSRPTTFIGKSFENKVWKKNYFVFFF